MTSEKYDFFLLVPDYLQGRLSAEQERAFSEELESNPDLRREVEDFSSLAQWYQQLDDRPEAAPGHLFARIEQRIAASEAVQTRKRETPRPILSLPNRLMVAWRELRASLWAPWTLAAVQAVVIAILIFPAPSRNTYSTLSRSTDTQISADRALLNVVFQPSATESQIRELLLAVNGHIQAGPSAQGRYIIAIAAGKDAAAAKTVLEQSPVVLFVDVAL